MAGKISCAKCGSAYVNLKHTDYTDNGKVETYYCESCKQTFTVSENNRKSSGDFIARFDTESSILDGSFIEVYRDKDGTTNVYQYNGLTSKKYLNRKTTPWIYLNKSPYGIVSIYIDTDRPNAKNDPNGALVSVNKIKLNDSLTKAALGSEAMRATWNKYKECFELGGVKNTDMLNDIISWLETNVGLQHKSGFQQLAFCYVATAVYGSYDCPEVWTLRRYRDYTLAETWYGRAFIRTYYAVSPTLVKWFGKTEWFKNMWKPKLDHMVKRLNEKGVANTPYNDRLW